MKVLNQASQQIAGLQCVGVEYNELRHIMACAVLRQIAKSDALNFASMSVHGDAETLLRTCDPFTHVYSYDVGFSPSTLTSIGDALRNSKSVLIYVSYQKPHILAEYR